MGKGPRRRVASIENGTRYLKTKGRISRKRVRPMGLEQGQVQGAGLAMQGSPEQGSPARKGSVGINGEEYDNWTDIHSRTSSSASTLSGCLSPILAEGDTDEPEEGGLSCSTSPRLYPSPTSAHSPALGTVGYCPNVELPQLTNITGTISLDKSGYSQQQQIKCNGYYVSGTKTEIPYCGPLYGQSSMGILQHHTPMETIQENKPVSFQLPSRAYSECNALQSLLIGGPAYSNKDTMLNQGCKTNVLLTQGNCVHSQHNHNQNHSQELTPNPSLHSGHGSVQQQNTAHRQNHKPGHKHQASLDYSHKLHTPHDYGQNHEHSHINKVNSCHDNNPHSSQSHPTHNPHNPMHNGPHQQALSPRVSPDILQIPCLKISNHFGPCLHFPTSPSLPPNPAGIMDVPQDPCRLATAPHPCHRSYPGAHHDGMTDSWQDYYHHNNQTGNSEYQGQQHNSHNRMAGQLEMENVNNGLDCNVDSILLSDFIDKDHVDFNFDGSLSQGVGMGMGMSLGAFACRLPAHNNQSWVPG